MANIGQKEYNTRSNVDNNASKNENENEKEDENDEWRSTEDEEELADETIIFMEGDEDKQNDEGDGLSEDKIAEANSKEEINGVDADILANVGGKWDAPANLTPVRNTRQEGNEMIPRGGLIQVVRNLRNSSIRDAQRNESQRIIREEWRTPQRNQSGNESAVDIGQMGETKKQREEPGNNKEESNEEDKPDEDEVQEKEENEQEQEAEPENNIRNERDKDEKVELKREDHDSEESEGGNSTITNDTSKIDRDNDIPKKFSIKMFNKSRTKGDGFCIISSVIKCLKTVNKKTMTKEELLKNIKVELSMNLDKYKEYINTSETDPIGELEEYAQRGTYNSGMGDLIIALISSNLKLRIVVLEQKKEGYVLPSIGHLFSPQNYNGTIYLEMKGEHYNSLFPNQERIRTRTSKPTAKVVQNNKPIDTIVVVEEEEDNINKVTNSEAGKDAVGKEAENGKEKVPTENKSKKYCVCRKVYNDNMFMIECGQCEEWYHPECVMYVCEKCTKTSSENSKSEVRRLRDELGKLQAENKVLRKDNRSQKEAAQDMEQKIEKIEGDNLRLQLKDQANNNRSWKSGPGKNKRTEEAKKQIETVKKANTQLKDKVTVYEGRIKTLKATTEAHKSRIKTLEEEVETLEKKCDDAENLLMSLDEIQDQQDEEDSSARSGEKSNIDVRKEIAKKTRDLKKCSERLNSTLVQNAKLKEDQVSSTSAIRHLTEYLDLYKRINKDLEITLSKNGLTEEVTHSEEGTAQPTQKALKSKLLETYDEEDSYKVIDEYYSDEEYYDEDHNMNKEEKEETKLSEDRDDSNSIGEALIRKKKEAKKSKEINSKTTNGGEETNRESIEKRRDNKDTRICDDHSVQIQRGTRYGGKYTQQGRRNEQGRHGRKGADRSYNHERSVRYCRHGEHCWFGIECWHSHSRRDMSLFRKKEEEKDKKKRQNNPKQKELTQKKRGSDGANENSSFLEKNTDHKSKYKDHLINQ